MAEVEQKQEVKVNCPCGSIVLKKNLSSHVKTKKHLAVVGGPPQLTRQLRSTRGERGVVNFADAQQTDVADAEDDDQFDEDDCEEDGFEDDVMEALEDISKHLEALGEVTLKIQQAVLELQRGSLGYPEPAEPSRGVVSQQVVSPQV